VFEKKKKKKKQFLSIAHKSKAEDIKLSEE